MRSTPAADGTRERIRDAAIERFARSGFGTGLRAIAADAEVSAALVVHYFGSKDGLRQACDEHVLRVVRENKYEATTSHEPRLVLDRMASVEEFAPLMLYVLRSLQDSGQAATSLMQHIVEDAEGYLEAGVAAGTIRPSRDPRARARYLSYQGIGGLLVAMAVEHPLSAETDIGPAFKAYSEATIGPALELFTEGLFTDRSLLDTYLMYVPDPPAEAGTPDRPDPPQS